MNNDNTRGEKVMKRYRLILSERSSWWGGDGVTVSRTNPVIEDEGTLEEVTEIAIDEILEMADHAHREREITADDLPGPDEAEEIRGWFRAMAAGAPDAPDDVPLDPGGWWCYTLEEVTN